MKICVSVLLTFSALLTACVGARVSTPKQLPPLPHSVGKIALAPSGGAMADAVGIELFNNGIQVIDTKQTSNYFLRINLDEIELMEPANRAAMKDQGIDAVLSVKGVAGYDGRPQSASVTVLSTWSGELIAAVTWQNGRGGAKGSPADSQMRKDLVGAAKQIGQSLVTQLRR